ncbi:MAG: pyridoxal-phosphate dependent enzyme [Flavobacteriales bacterium]|jgi:1-aminocyclopropane-1-carboxylate deaminase/D-cysteine desulfhydrase-like pyridoxal-dependent ACC family enzyme|nr:pyridoxal-phosphate dependent enzyme [Flavobacteriales bacterium]
MKIPSPLHPLRHPLFEKKGIEVWVKRDDLIHDEVSGNKWRKLKYNIQAFKEGNYRSILTFGGAYSNHILATAKVGFDFGIPTFGVIRGEEQQVLNPTLSRAKELGMQLHYISRTAYREKHSESFIKRIKEQFNGAYIIPEGGGNIEGVLGCKDIVDEITLDFDVILTDCGTGATLAGISLALSPYQKAIGIPVLKGGSFIEEEVNSFYKLMGEDVAHTHRIELHTDYHFGGYAKYQPELITFMQDFYKQTAIKTDPVYTGKLFYALMDLVQKDYFPKQSKIVVVHTGGLQGIAGFEKRYKRSIYDA